MRFQLKHLLTKFYKYDKITCLRQIISSLVAHYVLFFRGKNETHVRGHVTQSTIEQWSSVWTQCV